MILRISIHGEQMSLEAKLFVRHQAETPGPGPPQIRRCEPYRLRRPASCEPAENTVIWLKI